MIIGKINGDYSRVHLFLSLTHSIRNVKFIVDSISFFSFFRVLDWRQIIATQYRYSGASLNYHRTREKRELTKKFNNDRKDKESMYLYVLTYCRRTFFSLFFWFRIKKFKKRTLTVNFIIRSNKRQIGRKRRRG